MAEETVFFREGDVTISNTRAIIGSRTFAMANITSVSLGKIKAKRNALIIWAVLFFLVMIGGFSGNSPALGVVSLLVCGICIAVAFSRKDKYTVHIGSASGESDALMSKDETHIRKIVDAINDAIIHRG